MIKWRIAAWWFHKDKWKLSVESDPWDEIRLVHIGPLFLDLRRKAQVEALRK